MSDQTLTTKLVLKLLNKVEKLERHVASLENHIYSSRQSVSYIVETRGAFEDDIKSELQKVYRVLLANPAIQDFVRSEKIELNVDQDTLEQIKAPPKWKWPWQK